MKQKIDKELTAERRRIVEVTDKWRKEHMKQFIASTRSN
jgi:hypothetical protein